MVARLRRGHADRSEQNSSSDSHRDGAMRAAISLDNSKAIFGFEADVFCKTWCSDVRVHGSTLRICLILR
jgi:hypothetical protein